jgi:hypothetical protein
MGHKMLIAKIESPPSSLQRRFVVVGKWVKAQKADRAKFHKWPR